jgi:hypothetical protein
MFFEILAARSALKVGRRLLGRLVSFTLCCGATTILAVKGEKELREFWHDL